MLKLKEKSSTTGIASEFNLHRHEWQVIENFFMEVSRTERMYAVYCVQCLKSKVIIINLNKQHGKSKN